MNDIEIKAVAVGRQIQGWVRTDELEWLAKQALDSNLIIELGSWHGRSTATLACATPGKVIAIDTFKATNMEESIRMPEVLKVFNLLETDPEWLYKEFLKNINDFIEKIEIFRYNTNEAHKLLQNLIGKVDLLFIDADHSYKSVTDDITNYLPFVRKDGIICGHDYGFPGITEAVIEKFPKVNVVPETTIWWERC